MESPSEHKQEKSSSGSTESPKADKCSRCQGERFEDVEIRQIDGTATVRKCCKCGLLDLLRKVNHGADIHLVNNS